MTEVLKDKVVIVTGVGHGIGEAFRISFAQVRARVVPTDIHSQAAEQVASEVARVAGTDAMAVTVDVSDEHITKQIAAKTIKRFGRINVLVNNAAIFATIPMNRHRIEMIDPNSFLCDKLRRKMSSVKRGVPSSR